MESKKIVQEALNKIRNQFQEVLPGVKNPISLWKDTEIYNLFDEKKMELPQDLEFFYTLTESITRIEGDIDYSIRVEPIDLLESYGGRIGLLEGEFDPLLGKNEEPYDWVIFGGEGEHGYYMINCNKKSKKFGEVIGFIENKQKITMTWKSFHQFLYGLIDYCKKYPLSQYKTLLPMNDPIYGLKFKPSNA